MNLDLSAVKAHFVQVQHGRQRTLNALYAELQSTPNDPATINKAIDELHKIHGTAETLGYQRLGQRAQIAEELGETALLNLENEKITSDFLVSLAHLLLESQLICGSQTVN